VKFLAISGSLREGSTNTTLLRAAAMIAPEGVTIELFEGLGSLPHFNPDLDREGDAPPAPVAEFRARVDDADALLICSPEYAHGVPGTLKNALDWLVSSPVIVGKRVALLNASSRAMYAHASLKETLTVMSMHVIEVPVTALDGRKGLDAESIIADAELAGLLRTVLAKLMT
jgi:NAD(P)H-dependent FMN reductase